MLKRFIRHSIVMVTIPVTVCGLMTVFFGWDFIFPHPEISSDTARALLITFATIAAALYGITVALPPLILQLSGIEPEKGFTREFKLFFIVLTILFFSAILIPLLLCEHIECDHIVDDKMLLNILIMSKALFITSLIAIYWYLQYIFRLAKKSTFFKRCRNKIYIGSVIINVGRLLDLRRIVRWGERIIKNTFSDWTVMLFELQSKWDYKNFELGFKGLLSNIIILWGKGADSPLQNSFFAQFVPLRKLGSPQQSIFHQLSESSYKSLRQQIFSRDSMTKILILKFLKEVGISNVEDMSYDADIKPRVFAEFMDLIKGIALGFTDSHGGKKIGKQATESIIEYINSVLRHSELKSILLRVPEQLQDMGIIYTQKNIMEPIDDILNTNKSILFFAIKTKDPVLAQESIKAFKNIAIECIKREKEFKVKVICNTLHYALRSAEKTSFTEIRDEIFESLWVIAAYMNKHFPYMLPWLDDRQRNMSSIIPDYYGLFEDSQLHAISRLRNDNVVQHEVVEEYYKSLGVISS